LLRRATMWAIVCLMQRNWLSLHRGYAAVQGDALLGFNDKPKLNTLVLAREMTI